MQWQISRKVKPELGTMDDLAELAEKCHEKGISLCMDFVMNHTSEDHEWAVRARQGDGEYMSRYFFCADPSIPEEYEKNSAAGISHYCAGEFYISAGAGTLCDDDILSLSVGFKLPQSQSV